MAFNRKEVTDAWLFFKDDVNLNDSFDDLLESSRLLQETLIENDDNFAVGMWRVQVCRVIEKLENKDYAYMKEFKTLDGLMSL